MIWKGIRQTRAIAPRRRFVATALVYGLSLSVRFTSATGEEVEIPAEWMQRTGFVISTMNRNSVQFPYQDWSSRSAQPVALRQGWPAGGCRAACESSMPMSSMPGCVAP
jgi:hypothetical protein